MSSGQRKKGTGAAGTNGKDLTNLREQLAKMEEKVAKLSSNQEIVDQVLHLLGRDPDEEPELGGLKSRLMQT